MGQGGGAVLATSGVVVDVGNAVLVMMLSAYVVDTPPAGGALAGSAGVGSTFGTLHFRLACGISAPVEIPACASPSCTPFVDDPRPSVAHIADVASVPEPEAAPTGDTPTSSSPLSFFGRPGPFPLAVTFFVFPFPASALIPFDLKPWSTRSYLPSVLG